VDLPHEGTSEAIPCSQYEQRDGLCMNLTPSPAALCAPVQNLSITSNRKEQENLPHDSQRGVSAVQAMKLLQHPCAAFLQAPRFADLVVPEVSQYLHRAFGT
jgi:hypothetical protein